jgi:NADH:ubiquinone oxidoreductase subunit F (NADH-binding)
MKPNAKLLDDLTAAGLAGRGGAAFSTGIKVRATYRNRADLIVNACDGEIGASKDAVVVAGHLDELIRGAELVAPHYRQRVLFAAHRDSPTLTHLAASGVEVLAVPHRYVSSEASALVSLAQGGLGRPFAKRVDPVEGGRDSTGRRVRPTVVLNAETVWRVAQIAENGPAWFRSRGTEAEPGPRLATVTGYLSRPTVVETEAGVPLRELLDAAGGLPRNAEAVLVGGLGGAFLTADEARGVLWSSDDLRHFGAAIGPGVVTVLDPTRCPLDIVGEFLDYAAGESAGQCGPCMFGLPAVATAWRQVRRSGADAALGELRRHLGLLPGRGACAFPTGVARFGTSALRVFAGHVAEHRAGVCSYRKEAVHAHA